MTEKELEELQEGMDLLSVEETAGEIQNLLKRRESKSANEDELQFYVECERRIRMNKAFKRLLEKEMMDVEWSEEKQDYILKLAKKLMI